MSWTLLIQIPILVIAVGAVVQQCIREWRKP